jgi:hypothetical protein
MAAGARANTKSKAVLGAQEAEAAAIAACEGTARDTHEDEISRLRFTVTIPKYGFGDRSIRLVRHAE